MSADPIAMECVAVLVAMYENAPRNYESDCMRMMKRSVDGPDLRATALEAERYITARAKGRLIVMGLVMPVTAGVPALAWVPGQGFVEVPDGGSIHIGGLQ